MSRQIIDTTTDHGTYRGDPGKTAWGKANVNFEELYKLFQTAANKLGYFDASGNPAFTDITEFARSLIDDADAPAVRNTLQLGSAAMMKALGTVVPGAINGALIEYGSNVNGRYFRFFGGLQICIGVPGPRATVVTSSIGNIGYFGAAGSLTYPAAFANEIPVYIPSLTSIQNYFGLCPYDSEGTLTTTPYTYVWSPSSSFSARVGYVAIGRFY